MIKLCTKFLLKRNFDYRRGTPAFFIILSLFFFYSEITAQTITKDFAKKFVQKVIEGKEDISPYVLPEELNRSSRLGLTYENVLNKFLISQDINTNVCNQIPGWRQKYQVEIKNLAPEYAAVTFSIPGSDYRKEFIFKNSFLVSRPYYFSRNMKQINSKHFRFFIVDSLAFNAYSVGKLESFIDTAMRRLEYSAEDMRQLESAKIFYFACKDEKEIEEFTGYNTSGLYFLPYDYLITRFNCHYHELLHLLINFKLKHLPLYTNPFLQEGFAVAFGGRAGKEPEVINETGKFLIQSHFQEYQPLLQTGEFRNTDPSIAYPVAGIYNLFLFNRLGTEKYLKLYKKYSGQTDAVSWQGIDPLDLPSATDWERFLQEFENSQPVSFPAATNPAVQISGGRSGGIVQTGDYLFICLRDTMLLRGQNSLSLFYSSKFAELFPGRKYNGEKYAVLADTGEISVYNLFTGNLIAKYSLSFSLTGKPVPKENGLYQFLIKKSCFDEIPEVE